MESDNILSDEIKSWESFGEILRSNDRKLFFQMLNECKVYESGEFWRNIDRVESRLKKVDSLF